MGWDINPQTKFTEDVTRFEYQSIEKISDRGHYKLQNTNQIRKGYGETYMCLSVVLIYLYVDVELSAIIFNTSAISF